MLFTSSEIDERTYHNVTDSIKSTLEIARKERKDLDNTRELLMRKDSAEPKSEVNPTPSHAAPSSDVVVIRMKETAEA